MRNIEDRLRLGGGWDDFGGDDVDWVWDDSGQFVRGKGWDLFEVSTILSFLGFVSSHCAHVQAYAETQ